MKKLIRVTTIPLSLDKLLGEQLRFINGHFDLTAVAAQEEELKRVAGKYGVKHFHVEMTRQITPDKGSTGRLENVQVSTKRKPGNYSHPYS